MKKTVKKLLQVCVIVVLAILLFMLTMVLFVNPNKAKPLITNKIAQFTGREFKIEGDLSWTFFPNFGIKAKDLVLKNPPNFKNSEFIRIKEGVVKLSLLPLIRKKIESTGMEINDFQLNLIKNANGEINWAFVNNNNPNLKNIQVPDLNLEKVILALVINNVNFTHGHIAIIDEQKHSAINFKKFSLSSNKVDLSDPFPVVIKTDFYTSPNSTSHIEIDSQIKVNLSEQSVAMRQIKFNAEIRTPTGEVLHSASNGEASLDLFANQPIKVRGNIKIADLNLLGFHIHDLTGPIEWKDDTINIAPINGNLYSGDLKGTLQLQLLQSSQEQFKLQVNIANVDSQALLNDLSSPNQNIRIASKADFNLTLSTTGSDSDSFLKNLQGNGTLKLNQGALVGINLNTYIASVKDLLKGVSPESDPAIVEATNQDQTPFNSIICNYVIQNGVLIINNMTLDAPQQLALADGHINLINKDLWINVKLSVKKATPTTPDDVNNLFGLAVPVLISGSIDSFSIRLNTAELYNMYTSNQIKPIKVDEKTKEQIQKIPGTAGKFLQKMIGQ